MLTQDSKDNVLWLWKLTSDYGIQRTTWVLIDSKQEALLNDFKAKAIEWMPQIKANLVKGKFSRSLVR